VKVFELHKLPTGLYQVTGILVGVNGRRAIGTQLIKVQPYAGAR
jgi:hypothetical protein